MKKERHPTKKQVQKIIDALTKVLPAARKLDRKESYGTYTILKVGSIEMLQGKVDHSCGTPMCHAGWFAVGKGIGKGDKSFRYTESAVVMAKTLGFKDGYIDLEVWANNNPKIWGNKNGFSMFNDNSAFNYQGKLTLGKIITHWKGVQKRLPK